MQWFLRLKKLRVASGMSQKELAAKAHLTQGLISGLENNKKKFTQDNLEAILQALNCTYADLFTPEAANPIGADCNEKIKDLCRKVKEVVESDTHWGLSLEANIHSFKAGLDGDKERKEMMADIVELKKSNADLSLGQPKKTFSKKRTM